MVFLGEGHVLKMKRAVRFSFLDFTTLARRETACRSELRLNRRTAPQMYLHLGAVVREGPGLAIVMDADRVAPESVVEWLVVMRRFDRNGLARELALDGRLTQAMCEGIAIAVARLHLAEPPRLDRGRVEDMSRTVEGALGEIAEHGRGILPEEESARLASELRRAVAAAGPAIERRRSQGHVRHGHGDLHLGNICLFEGEPLLFDCIEFNEEFAVIDMLYDLSFLLMDLCHLERPGLANRVLNLWMEAMYPQPERLAGLSLLPLFLALRAAIRTHVHCSMAAVQPDAAGGEREARTARGYLAAARHYLAPVQPVLVAVGGVSGTGKSSLARALAPALGRLPGALVLRSDALRKAMHDVPADQRLPAEAYGPQSSEAVYRQMRQDATEALAAGHSVIMDAVHARPDERDALAALATACGVPFHGFWLDAPDALLRQRLAERRGDVSDADSSVLEQQRTYDPGPVDWQVLDAGAGLDAMLDLALAALPESWLRMPRGMA